MTNAAVMMEPNDPRKGSAALAIMVAAIDMVTSLGDGLANPTVAALARLITTTTLLCVLLRG